MFEHCKTLEELKKAYREAAFRYHPDRGGSDERMKEINAEYTVLFERLKHRHNAEAELERQTTETPEEFRNIISALISLDAITLEICGAWLWISGNTYQHRDTLKKNGCRFSHNKKMWYWRHEEDGATWKKAACLTIEEIRAKYGSDRIELNRRAELQGA